TLSDGNISGERLNERRQDPRTLSW
ncbi:MAG TPA: ABC transporter, partial [Marinobacter adhaerens]|nr:ABC transporter [Marinobacter adhaerens]